MLLSEQIILLLFLSSIILFFSHSSNLDALFNLQSRVHNGFSAEHVSVKQTISPFLFITVCHNELALSSAEYLELWSCEFCGNGNKHVRTCVWFNFSVAVVSSNVS